MAIHNGEVRAHENRLLQQIPGIPDIVWAILSQVDPARDPARLVFASSERRSGNTVLAAATAIGLVRHVRVPVCLVETNVEQPALARYLGLRETGLSDLLDGRSELDDCLQSAPDCPGLYVLPGGTPREPVSGELATPRAREILEEIGALGGYLVLDAPSLLDHLEARVLLREADGAVLVLRAGTTRMAAAERAHRILIESGVPLLGSVFNAYGHARARNRVEPYQLSKEDIARSRHGAAPDAELDSMRERSSSKATPPADAASALDLVANTPEAARDPVPINPGAISAEAHRREVELLERRIAKLTALLAETESDLKRIAAAKNIDLGIASVYRNVQGLAEEDGALSVKKDLLRKIFQSNLELQLASQRAT